MELQMKNEVFEYLNGRTNNQSRPTILEILKDTSCKTPTQARELHKEWILNKYKKEEENEEE